MYIRESNVIDAILSKVKAFVQSNNTIPLTHKNDADSLSAKARLLDSKINQLMEMDQSRYEDYIVGIADKEDLQQCRDKREALHAELQEINRHIEVLIRNNHRFQLYCNTLNNKGKIGLLVSEYLQNASVYSGERIETHFYDGIV